LLRSSIFRSVTVTRAHYSELQARLDAVYPSRGSKTYRAGRVLPIKLNVLNTFDPVQSSTSDDNNTNAKDTPNSDVDMKDDFISDDDCNLDVLFELLPAKIRYVDITPLNLQSPPPIAFPVFIRDEYDAMSSILNNCPKGTAGSCLITGQSSCGEYGPLP
jgi:hypothetical protein